jgi:hypothetical protein
VIYIVCSCDNHFVIPAVTKELKEVQKFQEMVAEVK